MKMMLGAIISAFVSYLPEMVFDLSGWSFFTRFMLSTMLGLIAYAAFIYYANKLEGG